MPTHEIPKRRPVYIRLRETGQGSRVRHRHPVDHPTLHQSPASERLDRRIKISDAGHLSTTQRKNGPSHGSNPTTPERPRGTKLPHRDPQPPETKQPKDVPRELCQTN